MANSERLASISRMHFNSLMVRLDGLATVLMLTKLSNFNSLMVRLDVFVVMTGDSRDKKFQFLNGAIGWYMQQDDFIGLNEISIP